MKNLVKIIAMVLVVFTFTKANADFIPSQKWVPKNDSVSFSGDTAKLYKKNSTAWTLTEKVLLPPASRVLYEEGKWKLAEEKELSLHAAFRIWPLKVSDVRLKIDGTYYDKDITITIYLLSLLFILLILVIAEVIDKRFMLLCCILLSIAMGFSFLCIGCEYLFISAVTAHMAINEGASIVEFLMSLMPIILVIELTRFLITQKLQHGRGGNIRTLSSLTEGKQFVD